MNDSDPSLDDLVRLAQAGDRRALEALVRALQGRLYRLALRMLGQPEPARDATQEILILLITRLSTFRGESAISTWAYRIATRYLLREKTRARRGTLEQLADNLGKPPSDVDPSALRFAEQRILEEELFIGCTQAMLQALEPSLRIAFVLGAICELGAPECAAILGIGPVAFRKRLSRARATLDEFLARHCGVADAENRCRCAYQINSNLARGRLDPRHLPYPVSRGKTTLEVLRACDEVGKVRRSLEVFQAQPAFEPTPDFAAQIRALLVSATALSGAAPS
jgi:RNA polymerase sigma factor (sigma-70 family)